MSWRDSDSASTIIRRMLPELLAISSRDDLLAHNEGHFEVQVLRALRRSGYLIQEGSPSKELADYVF